MNELAANGQVSPHQVISDLLNSFPQLVHVFLNHRMICVGCPMSKFDTLEDAANNYGLQVTTLIEEFCQDLKS